MRARFLGQNIALLGNGVAKLQTPSVTHRIRESDKKPKKDKHPPKRPRATDISTKTKCP